MHRLSHDSLVDLARTAAAFALLAAGCGERFATQATAAGTDTGSGSSGAIEDAPLDLPPEPPEPPSDDPPAREDRTFIDASDVPDGYDECSTWEQDCPVGEKCNAYADDGSSSWNAKRCVPLVPDPDPIGSACTVVDSPYSGLDSCERDAMCLYVDLETLVGRCFAFCHGTEASPVCLAPGTHCVGREFSFCVEECCPLEQDCGEGLGCYPAGGWLECAPDVGGDLGGFGDPCQFINVCHAGMFCADPSAVPGCDEPIGCCTSWCEVGSSTCATLHPALECVPWFEPGQAVPGLESLGGCLLPE